MTTLTKSQFDAAIRDGSLHLCLVGMSNCGKSYRSNQLGDSEQVASAVEGGKPFARFCVDDEIHEELEPHLEAFAASLAAKNEGGNSNSLLDKVTILADWMGQPYAPHFPERQKIYLDLEEKITFSALSKANKDGGEDSSNKKNFVLDTTGSVVNLSCPDKLRENYLVVHIRASPDMLEAMTERYFSCPKPVAWGTCFTQQEGESGDAALRRCYPFMLSERLKIYDRIAHVSIPAKVSVDPTVDCKQWLDAIRSQLPE